MVFQDSKSDHQLTHWLIQDLSQDLIKGKENSKRKGIPTFKGIPHIILFHRFLMD